MRTDRDNLLSVDIARALAALSVFVYHYGVGPVLTKYTGVSAFSWLGIPGANYGVTLFFVISGFCIHRSEWRRLQPNPSGAFDAAGYFGRRFRRIYPVYVFALLLSCLVDGVNSNWPAWDDICLHAVLVHGLSTAHFNGINVVLWTISVEFFFYLIYPVWLKYRLRTGLGRAIIVGTTLSVLSCCASALAFYPYDLPTRWFFLNNWGGWLVGALLAETIDQHAAFYRSWRWWLIGIAAWVFGLWAEANGFYTGRRLILLFPVRIYLSAWPLSALFLLEDRFVNSRNLLRNFVHIFSLIGLSSYSLYLLHEPLIGIRNRLQELVHNNYWRLVFQIGWFFVVLELCWLSYRYLELRFMKRSKPFLAPPVGVPAPPAVVANS